MEVNAQTKSVASSTVHRGSSSPASASRWTTLRQLVRRRSMRSSHASAIDASVRRASSNGRAIR
jgi:hypothetical protein